MAAVKKKVGRRRTIEEAIEGDMGLIRVRRERADENVTVTVRCGEVWTFTPDKLYECMEYLEMLGREVWVRLTDSNAHEFYVRQEGYDAVLSQFPPVEEEVVPWAEFREVLEDARQ